VPSVSEHPRQNALVTLGPTEEPLDEVRFIGNRSSGQMGLAIAESLLSPSPSNRWSVVVAAGPIRTAIPDAIAHHPHARVERFRTASDLEALMRRELPRSDLVVMAAAVADFRPRGVAAGKLRRTGEGLTIELEAVPDLLASTRDARKAGSRVYGFALEPAARLRPSALEKLARKDLAGIVANPLETMDAPDIDGTLFLRDGRELSPGQRLAKRAFAAWLAGVIA
jgi:phosphopantothenoylcysteine decarboxylase / phosphopantothenate---cysteine ligase